jgi:cytochrome c peroxidase
VGAFGLRGPEAVRELLRRHPRLWCDLAFRGDHARAAGRPRAGARPSTSSRALHGRHRHLHARALALHRPTPTSPAAGWPACRLPVAEASAWRNGDACCGGTAMRAPRCCCPGAGGPGAGRRQLRRQPGPARAPRARRAHGCSWPCAAAGAAGQRAGTSGSTSSSAREPAAAAGGLARRRRHARSPPRHELPRHRARAGRRPLPRRRADAAHAGALALLFDLSGADGRLQRLAAVDLRGGRAVMPAAPWRRCWRWPCRCARRRRSAPTNASRILSHGPWPPPPARDAGNAVAGRARRRRAGPAAVLRPAAVGRRHAWPAPAATCPRAGLHRRPAALAGGASPLDRNAPSLWNAVHERWLGWDGAADSLWSQALRPLLTNARLASRPEGCAAGWVPTSPPGLPLAPRLRRTGGRRQPAAAGAAGQGAGRLHRHAGVGADRVRPLSRRAGARRRACRRPLPGWRRCAGCSSSSAAATASCATPGRASATASLPTSAPASSCGRAWSTPAATAASARCWAAVSTCWAACRRARRRGLKTRHVQLQHRNFGEFKVPGLRNVALTAPYLHDGQKATLADMVRPLLGHWTPTGCTPMANASCSRCSCAARGAELLAFLQTLTDPGARRWQPGVLPRCR